MNAIEEVNRRFNEELQKQVNGTLPLGHVYQLGLPGEILLSAGFPAVPIEMAAIRLLQKSNQENHPFTLSEVKNMAYHLNNPVAIFRYKNESKNVIVDIEHEDKHFLIGIHFQKQRGGTEISSIRGIFPKDDIKWLNWIRQGKADYLNKEKIQALISQRRTNFADVAHLNLDSVAKIVQNFQNPPLKNQNTMETGYKQLSMSFDEPVEEVRYDALLEPEPLREGVEFANVQRVFEESKAFQFSAPNRITQPRDVAYIFKQLETAAVENAFAVLVKDGRPTVIHLSMGMANRTLVSLDAAMAADRKINADKIYLVHNHPSGNIYASQEDVAMLDKWEQVFGNKMQPGIIINSRTGLFGTFSTGSSFRESSKEELTMEAGQKQYPVKLYSFSRLVFNKDYKEQGVIRSSSDVASFVAGQRLGARNKFSYLVLAGDGSLQANIHTAHSSVQRLDDIRVLADQIANDTNVFGGAVVITYGSAPLTQMQTKRLQEELRYRDVVLQDHVNVQADINSLMMNAAGVPYKYQSARDLGWLGYAREPALRYGKEDVQLRFAKKADEFERIRDLAVQNKGLVIPGLMDKEVPLVGVDPHDFYGDKALTQAEIWAKNNLVGEHKAKDNMGEVFAYSISGKAIEKYLSSSATTKSDSIGVHLSVLKRLPDVVARSAEAEIHPDYLKGPDGKRRVENGYAPNVLMHRFYGAINIDEQTYRVKTTIQEITRTQNLNVPHSYEVTKIEMLDLKPSISLAPTHKISETRCVGLAKLLQGIEKSYDPGKKILDESQKLQQGVRQDQEKSIKERFSTSNRKIQPKPRKRGRGL